MELIIIGGGLAGSEAAWQAAQRGINVKLYEMRPIVSTGAHETGDLAELVCSNSLGSNEADRPSGLLKDEVRQMGSLLLHCAEQTALPAGSALAVDRSAFAARVTERLSRHPRISIIRQEVTDIPSTPTILASGPLTSPALAASLSALTGQNSLFFYDAIAPIVSLESIDLSIAFRASRNRRGEIESADYINCPFDKAPYFEFVEALRTAQRIELKGFEQNLNTGVRAGIGEYFEACLPVEVLAGRDPKALAFGPMRPIGLYNPVTGHGVFAVVQLRQDNLAGTLYNLVGFQTNLTFTEQQRVFRMIPGLGKAEFVRYGQMHRNTFFCSPRFLKPSLQFNDWPDLLAAGQMMGVEGYMGNIATGLVAGVNAARQLTDRRPVILPPTSMTGALIHYATHAEPATFQPMKANFGLLPELVEPSISKRARSMQYAQRALQDLKQALAACNFLGDILPGEAL